VVVVMVVNMLLVVMHQLTWVAVAVVPKAPEVINLLVVLEAPVLLLYLILMSVVKNF
jgi:hypothetical protein